MKKKVWKVVKTILIVVLLIIGLYPTEYLIKDGGTVSYEAILYGVTRVHHIYIDEVSFELHNKLVDEADTLTPDEKNAIEEEIRKEHEGYIIGTRIRILFFVVYDDTEVVLGR